jgi:ribosome modulation factor
MPQKELRKADWFDQQELDEREFQNGYEFYLSGEPYESNVKPSLAFMAGWREAKADREAIEKENPSMSEGHEHAVYYGATAMLHPKVFPGENAWSLPFGGLRLVR